MLHGLTKNELKLVAAASMVIDHVGAELFPGVPLFRILGRAAFPIFAYAVYEGCRYTHDRGRYLAQMLGLGLLCVAGYAVYAGVLFGNVLITFSLSICILLSIRFLRESLSAGRSAASGAFLTAAAILGAYLLCRAVEVDYGFCGVLAPVFAELFTREPERRGRPAAGDPMALAGFALGLALLAIQMRGEIGGAQVFSFLALPLLAASNGRRGKHRLKWFFYFFYPAHLLVIGAAAALTGA